MKLGLSQAALIAFALAMSSTAFALQLMRDSGESQTLQGRSAFSEMLPVSICSKPPEQKRPGSLFLPSKIKSPRLKSLALCLNTSRESRSLPAITLKKTMNGLWKNNSNIGKMRSSLLPYPKLPQANSPKPLPEIKKNNLTIY